LIDAADGTITKSVEDVKAVKENPTALQSDPEVKGSLGGDFYYSYDADTNTATVYIGDGTNDLTGDLTQETNAQAYKNQETNADEE
jgi:hypothetical protein